MTNVYEVLKDLGHEIPEELRNYYSNIEHWKKWWQGYVPEFHKYKATNIEKELIEMKRKTLKMAKKVSEDWANLLLNDKTTVVIDETVDIGSDSKDDSKDNVVNESQKFVTGDENEQTGGVFGLSKFWKNGNKTVEKEYALGTAAFILVPHKPKLLKGKLIAESVKINCIKEACCIIPLSWDGDDITECAFASSKQIAGKSYMYLQIMLQLADERYKVENHYYLRNGDSYDPVKENPKGEALWYTLPAKPFFILSPNIENNILETTPMGISVFANAIDQLMACDIAYDNMFNDFILGRKKVFMSQDVISTQDIPVLGDDGKPKMDASGKPIVIKKPMAGEAIEQSMYVNVGQQMPNADKFFQEYNPSLRMEENKNGIQFALNLLSSKVGFGQNKYQFNMQTMATATEVKVSNKDLTESVWKQRVIIQDVLTEMTRSILAIGREICGKPLNPDAKITVKFDNTMFNDEEAERLRDMQEVNSGLMMDWEFRVKWYGETEKQAKEILKTAASEKGITYEGEE